MTLTATERQFLHIAKAAVSDGEVTAESVDWPAVFALAGQQKLLPIVFEAVRKTPAAAENAALFAAVKQQVIAQVLHQTMRASEFAGLYQKLRAAGLHPVVVKGQLCSRLYPLKDHRISADDDLYISDAEFMACHKQLLANGLTTDTPADEFATADEVSYTKSDSPLYIELHRHLFDSAGDAHDELNHFFADLNPVEIDGFLAMPPHEHLLYRNRQISRRIKKHLWLSNRSWARDVHSFGILHSWGALAGKSCSAQASSIWLIAGAFRRTQSK